MKTLLKISGIILVVIITWHIKVNFTPHIKINSFFSEEPLPGYTWKNSSASVYRRFFWQKTATMWTPGLRNLEFNTEAAQKEDEWMPLPGYKFQNSTNGDFSTLWKPGLTHPKNKAVSAKEEGSWTPFLGYRFKRVHGGDSCTVWQPGIVYQEYKIVSLDKEGRWKALLGYKFNDTTIKQNNLAVHWVPGIKSKELKIYSDQIKDNYLPMPGYRFVNRYKSLGVIWTPGLVNSNNSNYIAGAQEGVWEINHDSTIKESTLLPYTENVLALNALSGFTKWLFNKDDGTSWSGNTIR